MNELSKLFINLTQPSVGKEVSIRADLIGVIETNTRGSTDVYTTLTQDGDAKVYEVSETKEEIMDAMRKGMASLENTKK